MLAEHIGNVAEHKGSISGAQEFKHEVPIRTQTPQLFCLRYKENPLILPSLYFLRQVLKIFIRIPFYFSFIHKTCYD